MTRLVRALVVTLVVLVVGVRVTVACPKGRKAVERRTETSTTYACADRSGRWQGRVTVKDKQGQIMSAGSYNDGRPHGQWTIYGGDGHVLARPLYDHGRLISGDSMTGESGASDED